MKKNAEVINATTYEGLFSQDQEMYTKYSFLGLNFDWDNIKESSMEIVAYIRKDSVKKIVPDGNFSDDERQLIYEVVLIMVLMRDEIREHGIIKIEINDSLIIIDSIDELNQLYQKTNNLRIKAIVERLLSIEQYIPNDKTYIKNTINSINTLESSANIKSSILRPVGVLFICKKILDDISTKNYLPIASRVFLLMRIFTRHYARTAQKFIIETAESAQKFNKMLMSRIYHETSRQIRWGEEIDSLYHVKLSELDGMEKTAKSCAYSAFKKAHKHDKANGVPKKEIPATSRGRLKAYHDKYIDSI